MSQELQSRTKNYDSTLLHFKVNRISININSIMSPRYNQTATAIYKMKKIGNKRKIQKKIDDNKSEVKNI